MWNEEWWAIVIFERKSLLCAARAAKLFSCTIFRLDASALIAGLDWEEEVRSYPLVVALSIVLI
jgi:hypothetical protein